MIELPIENIRKQKNKKAGSGDPGRLVAVEAGKQKCVGEKMKTLPPQLVQLNAVCAEKHDVFRLPAKSRGVSRVAAASHVHQTRQMTPTPIPYRIEYYPQNEYGTTVHTVRSDTPPIELLRPSAKNGSSIWVELLKISKF